jgi:hypothetical protein
MIMQPDVKPANSRTITSSGIGKFGKNKMTAHVITDNVQPKKIEWFAATNPIRNPPEKRSANGPSHQHGGI